MADEILNCLLMLFAKRLRDLHGSIAVTCRRSLRRFNESIGYATHRRDDRNDRAFLCGGSDDRGGPSNTRGITYRRTTEFHYPDLFLRHMIASSSPSLILTPGTSSCPPSMGTTPSRASLYSTESTRARQLASTMFADTPTVPHWARRSPEQINTRTKLAVPDRLLVITRTL